MLVRVSFSNGDLEDMNLYPLIKFDQFDKSLNEYTHDLIVLISIVKTISPVRPLRICISEV